MLKVVLVILFWIFIFIIFEAMVGYPISLFVLGNIFKNKTNKKDYDYVPDVTIMVVAHNEEKVIEEKLNNLLEIDYPIHQTTILVTSDYSTDKTNEIVNGFIDKHKDRNIILYEAKEHRGKTNAQNEAQKIVKDEILVMTDANAILDKKAIREIVSFFSDENVAYVSGKLAYVNEDNTTAASESLYWKLDLYCRELESRFGSITAGNGALYACRNSEYIVIKDKYCHDNTFPLRYALLGKKALYNPEAVAYEKAGENDKDEYKRKVRMNRDILLSMFPSIKLLEIWKHFSFSYFYFGHRTCRYSLWISHLMVFVLNAILMTQGLFWIVLFGLQLLFYLIAIIGSISKTQNRLMRLTTYYCMTVFAQWNGVYNIVTGKAKPTWEKAESTR